MTGEGELIAGRYLLTSRLGTGAMGVVWQARDERLRRTVAIKQLLLPSGLSDTEADEANHRAMREGRITARLHHPHAIAVYDVVEHQGQPCLVMEYLPSSSLATVLSIEGALQPDRVAKIGSQIASALAVAHQAGIVHRDIKPGNVLLADDGTAKITDFGISHAVGDVTVTATGILAGTPAYLAPEVAQGNSAGFPSDVFSFGSTLYTALEGTPPFGLRNNPIAQLHQVASGEIRPPSQSGALTPVLLRLLHRNPDQRPTMQQAQDALVAAVAGPEGGPPTSTLHLSANDSPATPIPRTQQTRIGAEPLDETFTPARTRTSQILDTPASRPPPESNGDGRPQRRGLFAGAAAAVVAAGVLVVALISNGALTSDNTASPLANPSRPAQSSPAVPAQQSPAVPTQQSSAVPTQQSSAVPTQQSSAVPTQPGQSGTTQVITPTPPVSPPGTPEQLQQAITNYYALIPGDLPAAWNRLTANYQQNHAGGFTGYQNFWNPVQRVTVSDISAGQGDAVDATVNYFFKDGRVIEERTGYGLVDENGLWKIDSSTVRSSQAK